MNGESSNDREMRELWQSQKTEGVRMSVEQIRLSAGKFQRRIEWRNAREYAAALVVVAFFGFQFIRTGDALTRLGFGLIIAGVCYVIWQLHARGSGRPLPEDMGLASSIEFQRHELKRQRDLLRSVWNWYLGPVIPGLAVLIAAFARTNPGHLKHFELILTTYVLVIAGAFVGIAKLNERAARRLQRRIDELDDLSSQG